MDCGTVRPSAFAVWRAWRLSGYCRRRLRRPSGTRRPHRSHNSLCAPRTRVRRRLRHFWIERPSNSSGISIRFDEFLLSVKILLSFFRRMCLSLRIPLSQEGRFGQSSRTLGAGCDGRKGRARRARPVRTAKSCGPDLPTLGSSPVSGDVGLWPARRAGDGG